MSDVPPSCVKYMRCISRCFLSPFCALAKKEFANPYLGSSGTHDLLTHQMLAVTFAALSLVMPAPRGAASHRLISSGPLRTGSCATMLEAAQATPLHGFLADMSRV